jgi:hypothetical protein
MFFRELPRFDVDSIPSRDIHLADVRHDRRASTKQGIARGKLIAGRGEALAEKLRVVSVSPTTNDPDGKCRAKLPVIDKKTSFQTCPLDQLI